MESPGGRHDERGHRDGKGRSSRDVWSHRIRAANLGVLRYLGLLRPGRCSRLRAPSAIQRRNGRARPKELTWASGAATRRRSPNCSPASASSTSGAAPDSTRSSRPGKWGPRLGDRRRHDARDDHEGPREHREDGPAERRVPARRDRAPARGGRERRRDHVELRDQPLARQARGLPRSVPRARPGGRLAISDIVALREIPAAVRNDLEAYAGCVSGAALIAEVERMLRDAGFEHVRVDLKSNSDALVQGWSPGAESLVASALIRATKPRAAGSQR